MVAPWRMSGRRKRRRTKRKLRFPGCLGIAKALLLLLIEKRRGFQNNYWSQKPQPLVLSQSVGHEAVSRSLSSFKFSFSLSTVPCVALLVAHHPPRLLANRKWHMPWIEMAHAGPRPAQSSLFLESLGEKEREWTERRTRQNGRHQPALVGAGWLAGWPRRWPQRTRQNPISRERSSGARRPQFFLTFLYFALAHHAAHFSTHHKP